jgi:hypothetical protein
VTDIMPLIQYMQSHGSSLDLNWGEDNNAWEVSWINGGRRFVGRSHFLASALLQSAAAACDHYGMAVPDVMRPLAHAADLH